MQKIGLVRQISEFKNKNNVNLSNSKVLKNRGLAGLTDVKWLSFLNKFETEENSGR